MYLDLVLKEHQLWGKILQVKDHYKVVYKSNIITKTINNTHAQTSKHLLW